jgi:hypothetical protein
MFDINKYIQENRSFDCPTRLVKEVVCQDGFRMSVQAGPSLYSSPRDWADEYTEVEVGFPSQMEVWLMPFIDEPDADPTDTVYGYVPVETINQIVEDHGGLA